MTKRRPGREIILYALSLMFVACAKGDDVKVRLEAHQQVATEPDPLEVQAQVTGPASGLQYKWYSGAGEFDPQESYSPKTTFLFGPNSRSDRIWVEVWRDRARIAFAELDITKASRNESGSKGVRRDVQISITDVPRYDPNGGPDTRDDIAGRVTGTIKGSSVVIYARADAWYIQPTPYALHVILQDGSWKSWTHTGSNYAVLVVRDGYRPVTRLDVLPGVEGDVYARTIIEGKKE